MPPPKYRYLDAAEKAQAVIREDALVQEKRLLEATILADTVKSPVVAAKHAETRDLLTADVAERSKRARVTPEEIATAKRDFLDKWIGGHTFPNGEQVVGLEEEHISVATMAELVTDEKEAENLTKRAAELEAILRAAYKALDAIPKPKRVAGDGGTANRQARRAQAKKKPAAKAETEA